MVLSVFLPLEIREKQFFQMRLTVETKKELFTKYSPKKSATDTGSAESQIALWTTRINHLTSHLKTNKKDFSTQTGLLNLVGKRKRLLNYLQNADIDRYRAILSELDLRK
jgi:small subunit ribosomal protein S15